LKEKKKGRLFTPQKFKSTYSCRIKFYNLKEKKKGRFFHSPRIQIQLIVIESYSMNLKEEKKEHSLLPQNSNPHPSRINFE
jgi:hypothetical protein